MQEKASSTSSNEPDMKEKLNPSAPLFTPNMPAETPSFSCETNHPSNVDRESATKRSASQMTNARDFESVTMMKMRQAEERKKLIEQMMKEEEES